MSHIEMQPRNGRLFWLAVGLVAGICLSYFWPHEPAHAVTTDRDSKFAMATVTVSPVDTVEGLFVLDFLTGQLTGAILNQKTGKFNTKYARNLAADFNVDPKAEPHYAIVSGRTNLPGGRGVSLSSGSLYIGELSSGKVICYTFPVRVSNRLQTAPLQPIDYFQFREPTVAE